MAENQCLGIVRIGRMEVAIPGDHFQEVVPGPLPVAELPGAAPCIVGTALVRGEPLPVLDLARLLQPDAPPVAPGSLHVVLHSSHGRLAVLADAVVTVLPAVRSGYTELTGAASGPEAVFRRATVEDSRVIHVLEVDALVALPGVRTAVQAEPRSESEAVAGEELTGWLFLRVGGLNLAVDIWAAVGARKVPPLQGANFDDRLVLGFFRSGTHETALIDLLDLLEVPKPANAGRPEEMLVIESGGRSLAFGISEVLSVERHPAGAIRPVSGHGLPRSELYRGTFVSRRHGQVLVLDHAALLAHPEVASLTAIPDTTVRAVAATDPGEGERANHIVYRAGKSTVASPIGQVEAVLPHPADLSALRRGDGPFLGYFTWRGEMVPLLDLGVYFGAALAETDRAESRVLVVRTDSGLRGYLVQRVDSLQIAVPKSVPWRDQAQSRIDPALPPLERMIPIHDEAGRRNACLLDLRAVRIEAASGAVVSASA